MTEQTEYKREDLERIGAKWIDRIRASEDREKTWMDDAEEAETAYLCDTDGDAKGEVPEFNILHSNVETIVPSIYNSTPVPDLRPRHNNKDEIGKNVSEILERAITVQIDDSKLDIEIELVAQDAFMAGRGIIRVRFDADEEQTPAQMGMDEATGEEYEATPAGVKLVNERLIFENVSWRDYREGPAKRWADVPWNAFRHSLSQTDLDRIQDAKMVEAQKDETKELVDEELDADVWEIWCKKTRRVYFVANDSAKVLSISEDPMGLKDFFCIPQPVQPIVGTGKRTPVCPYRVYKALAEQLDMLTRRIDAITRGLKVKGGFSGSAEDLERLARADDNELIPIANIEGLVAAGGLEKAIVWWPIDKAIMVLRELYANREQVKQSIYEITGISDIIRGQGAASETATAQNIKTQWGSLRIKKMQRQIERSVRDVFVISAQVISKHFSEETLQKLTGLQISDEAKQLLGSPLEYYRIDVESDSTVRADLTRQRGEMAEFLNGTANFFGTMAPLVEKSPTAGAPIADMFAAFARQFSLGKQAEDAIDQLAEMAKQMAQEPPPNPEAEAKKAEMEQAAKSEQARMQLEMEKLKLDSQKAQMDLQIKGVELQIKQAEVGIKQDQAVVAEKKAEVDTMLSVAELQMEEDQQRAVKLGDD